MHCANYEKLQEKYKKRLAETRNQRRGTFKEGEEEIKEPKAPAWRESNIPTLREWCIGANANVPKLEPSEDSSFDSG